MSKNIVLVVGAGISGITASVEIAEVGYDVILIEKLPYLGGRVSQISQYFPKFCPPFCGLEINYQRLKNNSLIKVYTSTTIKNISGSKGNFTVLLETKPTFINNNCTICGECVKVCPVERNNDFNYNMDKTRAIYIPHKMAFPLKYSIDENVCLKDKCNKCTEVCDYGAIDLKEKEKLIKINVGSVLLATGWQPYDANKINKLGFNTHPDIITNVMMERLCALDGPTGGIIKRPSDNITPKKIAFVQCAGSRDENHLPYCSGVCCSATLKQAVNYIKQTPEGLAKVFYIDLRISGRNEDLLSEINNNTNIDLIKGKVVNIEIEKETKKVVVEAEDILSGIKIREQVDMVILATGIVPTKLNLDQIKHDNNGFIIPEQSEDGIFPVACAKKPLDVSSSVKDSTGMALKAIQTLK